MVVRTAVSRDDFEAFCRGGRRYSAIGAQHPLFVCHRVEAARFTAGLTLDHCWSAALASITIRNRNPSSINRVRLFRGWAASALVSATSWSFQFSAAKQAASEHGLHVTWALHNQINNHFVVSNTVDHSVRLNEGLPVFFDAKADQLSGMTCLPSVSGRLGAKASARCLRTSAAFALR